MILRLWKGRTLPESADAYYTHVTRTVFQTLTSIKGFRRGRVLCRRIDGQVEFLVITEWTSLDAIRAFAGDQLDQAVVEPAAQAVLIDYSQVAHFEVVH